MPIVAQTVGQVIRPVLVLLVCLALPVNAATAVYQHLHTESGHATDHHDGREMHRHVTSAIPHGHGHPADNSPADVPESETDIITVPTAAWRPAQVAVADTISKAVDLPSLQLMQTPGTGAPAFVAPGDVRTSHESLPDDPATTAPALRGPPR